MFRSPLPDETCAQSHSGSLSLRERVRVRALRDPGGPHDQIMSGEPDPHPSPLPEGEGVGGEESYRLDPLVDEGRGLLETFDAGGNDGEHHEWVVDDAVVTMHVDLGSG